MNLININTNQIRNRGSPPTTSIQKKSSICEKIQKQKIKRDTIQSLNWCLP